MKLLLVRHGETVGNVKKIIQGHTDGHLTEKGFRQAEKLAEYLRKEKIDVIYTSDLMRAKITALEIKKYHKSAELIVTDKIREMFWGELEGKPYSYMKNNRGLDGFEKKPDIISRTKRFLGSVLRKNKDKTVVIVTHYGTLIGILANILKEPFDSVQSRGIIDNTGITVFDPYPNMVEFNSIEHLN